MQTASRGRRLCAALPALALAALFAGGALAQEDKKDKDKDKSGTSRKVTFDSFDGVRLSGTFYPKPGGTKDKDACVLLLHSFDLRKGGNSHQDGWDHLAESLQQEGYAVLSFDFRGFGDSKQVSREQFWDRTKAPMNQMIRTAARAPETIDFKEFPPGYYPVLVNDIAAARTYLDRKNDNREVNTSNLVLVGAGEGATLGSMWLAGECKRKRVRGFAPPNRYDLDEPESRDVACAVWLSINPGLAGIRVPLGRWLVDAAADQRIPMGFLYGADDAEGKEIAATYENSIRSAAAARGKGKLEFTARDAVKNTKLRGSQLLTKSLTTEDDIKHYLDRVIEKRGVREARSRDPLKTQYVWSFHAGYPPIPAKTDQEELLRAMPLNQLMR